MQAMNLNIYLNPGLQGYPHVFIHKERAAFILVL